EGINHETGDISDKLKRGRHTTRHVELIYLPELEGSILDTPGFSFYDFKDDFNIADCYKEFEPYKDMCRFNMCTHTEEPDCAVRAQVGKEINRDRYERYVMLQKAREELRSKKYD
ncbi:MAG: GTPase RsgA, partial [Clostridia bacterium]|nr:GTPase RsgA [Clostridia bacterium]